MVEKNRILIIGVDKDIHKHITQEFVGEEYEFITTTHGKEGLIKLRESRINLIVLDEKLVDVDGEDLCQTIRLENQRTPIIYISYHDDEEKRNTVLRYGANDFLVKPLSYKEIYYKISNYIILIGRNKGNKIEDQVEIGDYIIDFKSFMVKNKIGDEFKLTKRQIKLLKLLIEKNNEVVSREEILEKIWGYDVFIKTRTIDNVILSLRKIFEKNKTPNTYFKSVRGVGYKLTI